MFLLFGDRSVQRVQLQMRKACGCSYLMECVCCGVGGGGGGVERPACAVINEESVWVQLSHGMCVCCVCVCVWVFFEHLCNGGKKSVCLSYIFRGSNVTCAPVSGVIFTV